MCFSINDTLVIYYEKKNLNVANNVGTSFIVVGNLLTLKHSIKENGKVMMMSRKDMSVASRSTQLAASGFAVGDKEI